MAEYSGPEITCIVTGACGATLHHVRHKGSGGSDDPENLMPLCHRLHQELHQCGLNYMSAKYPPIKKWLLSNGWTYDTVKNKWSCY